MTAIEALARTFVEEQPVDAARCFDGLDASSAGALLGECPPRAAALVLEGMAPGHAADCLAAVPAERLPELAKSLGDAALARFARRLDGEALERLSSALPSERGARVRALTRYPERSVGALMDARPLALPAEQSVALARAQLRPLRDLGLGAIYVVANAGALEGVVSLSRLAAADDRDTLRELMTPPPPPLSPLPPAVSQAAHPGWAATRELPVVDDALGLVGRLRLDTVEHLSREEQAASPPAVSVTLALGELYWRMAASLLGAAGAGSAGIAGEGSNER